MTHAPHRKRPGRPRAPARRLLSAALPPELHARLCRLAFDNNQSLRAYVSQVLTQHLEQRQ
jgi:predicted HicB family RNase H-like nuclease